MNMKQFLHYLPAIINVISLVFIAFSVRKMRDRFDEQIVGLTMQISCLQCLFFQNGTIEFVADNIGANNKNQGD